MAAHDDTGKRGENLCATFLTDFFGRNEPFFRLCFLGDKWPGFDFLVDLVGTGEATRFFLVQVRATRLGYTKTAPIRLRIKVSSAEVRRILLCPIPAYIIGIDNEKEVGFLYSVRDNTQGSISSLPTTFPINCDNLKKLWEEVAAFWDRFGNPKMRSIFSD